jgi:hypothetical protein
VAETATVELPAMTGPQVRILSMDERAERCWDVEGAPRSAKSWGVVFWIWKLVWRYPGIRIFYCRYKDDDLKSLKEVWSLVAAHFPAYMHPKWNAEEEAWDFPNGSWHGKVYGGSRVLLSSLRVSEAMTADAIHGKYKGKTIAVVVIEEAQEVPFEHYRGLKERLSQTTNPLGEKVDYPLKIVLVHNSVDEDHWICREFPVDDAGNDCTREDHAHIRSDLYSNAGNLGEKVLAGYETDYPKGHPLRRTVIEGRRGATQMGKPVYGAVFDRQRHVSKEVKVSPFYPVLEGWDFGEEKPCVSWWQHLRHLGAMRCVGGVKGKEIFLETFATLVLMLRVRLFPGFPNTEFWTWCDPTGATGNQGMNHTAIRHLQGLGVAARFEGSSNRADVRYGAIQVIAGYLERMAKDGSPAMQMIPQIYELQKLPKPYLPQPGDVLLEMPDTGVQYLARLTELHIAAFSNGYVWDDHASPDGQPNIRKPKKGTRYDDFMNSLEYVVIGEKISVPSDAEIWSASRQMRQAEDRVRHMEAEKAARPLAVGPTGETLTEAMTRIARMQKSRGQDRDPADRSPHVHIGRRGGW